MKEISKTPSGKKLPQNDKYHKLKFKTLKKNYISINIYKTECLLMEQRLRNQIHKCGHF